jgi:hypothetical protein
MRRLLPTLIAALALTLAATAVAEVAVYKNPFGKRADFKAVKKLQGGGKCGKSWKGKRSLGVRVKGGKRNCTFRTPVEGDRKLPDHTIQAIAKVLRKTDRKLRKSVYTGVALRVNRKSQYEVRIYPKGRRWELLKSGLELDSGKDSAIAALNEKNRIRLAVTGDIVVAKVNGTKLATFEDQSPKEVSGRKTALTFGSEARSKKKKGLGMFDKVKVLVPDP